MDLELCCVSRFGRALEYDIQRVEQPSFLITGTGALSPNPEHYLNEHTIKFQFSEVFPASSTLASSVKNACTLSKKAPECQHKDAVLFDSLVAGDGWWRRALSGVTLTADLSERTALQQGVVVLNPSFANHYQVTGGIDFDPTQLFINGGNWSKAAAAFGSTTYPACKIQDKQGKTNATQSVDPAKCINDLSRARLGAKYRGGHNNATALLAAVVPTISFKRVSQFDFVKNGGILIPAPYLENAQTQLTFKWDLKKAIPSSTAMLDPSVATAPPAAKLCVIVSGEPLHEISSVISVKEDFPARSCAKTAYDFGSNFKLACVQDTQTTSGLTRIGNPDARITDLDPDKETCWRDASTSFKPSTPTLHPQL